MEMQCFKNIFTMIKNMWINCFCMFAFAILFCLIKIDFSFVSNLKINSVYIKGYWWRQKLKFDSMNNSDIFRDLIFYNHILYCLLRFPLFNSWYFVLKWQSLTGLFLKIFLNMEISWEISKTVLHIKRCISWLYLSPRFFLVVFFFINWYILLNHHHFITYVFF